MTISANEETQAQSYTLTVSAIGPGGSQSASATITQPASPVEGLDWCTNGTSGCDLGPYTEQYQTWGNVYPADLGDCTFAAAADWEQIAGYGTPDPSVIGYEFAQAGGTASGGLSLDAFLNYWEQDGIANVTISGVQPFYTDQTDTQNGVQDYGALLAELQFGNSDYVGDQSVTAGYHLLVVDGYTPEGPLVVTWGQTIQMSWQQWNGEVVGIWEVEGASSN
ncbi:MAG TPA: hypothetical protein VEJ84_16325 [Acidimicrobiales bacterium]|nr:hypothetical protein [Acidimicrobiales bacterium]